MRIRRLAIALLICCPVLGAQEVRYVDLTAVEQRTQLRYPHAAETPLHGICGGGSGGMEGEGPDIRDPHALGVYLTHRTATRIDPAQPFQVEFKVVNTGRAPIEVPVSPDLSDLQPADDSIIFHYLSITLAVSVVEDPHSTAFVTLYGSAHHDQSVVTLQPGEWVRVTANVKLEQVPETDDTARLAGSFWLQNNTFYPRHPGGCFTESDRLYPNVTPTPPLKVFWLGPAVTP